MNNCMSNPCYIPQRTKLTQNQIFHGYENFVKASWAKSPLGPEKFMKSKSNSSKFLEYPHFDDNEGYIDGGFKGDWNLLINENLCIV